VFTFDGTSIHADNSNGSSSGGSSGIAEAAPIASQPANLSGAESNECTVPQ